MLRTGKKPARPEAVKLRFGAYFNATALPSVPYRYGRPQLIQNWKMLANDIASCCVESGAAHETMLAAADVGNPIPTFTNTTVLSDYRAVNPDDPMYSGGTDLQTYAAYRQKIGISDTAGVRHKIDVYASLRAGDLAELDLSTFLFGFSGIGVRLPESAKAQFNYAEVWNDVSEGASDGHYMAHVGRNSRGNYLFVTWGRLIAATPQWVQTYMDEGLAIFSRERLNAKGYSPQGYAEAALEDDFKQVTGG